MTRLPVLRLVPLVALLCLLGALAAPMLFSHRESNLTWDEQAYYLPAVERIGAHWPRLDLLEDSLSATAPGYAYFLATVGRVTGTGVLTLRLVTFLISAVAIVYLVRAWPGGVSLDAVAVVAPLALSNFFVKSSAFVVTDNPALLCTAIALVAVIWSEPAATFRAGLAAAVGVLIRQSSAWLVAPLLLGAWTGPGRRIRLRGIAGALPPLLALGVLVVAWHGLTPPAWRDVHLQSGLGHLLAIAVYLLALLALFAPAYLHAGGQRLLRADRWSLAGAATGLILAAAGPTTYSESAGRWGGYLWHATRHLPAIQERSLLFLVLAPAGGWFAARLLGALGGSGSDRRGLRWTGTLAAWLAANLVNAQSYHRYYEPLLLVMLILWLGLVRPSQPGGKGPRRGALWLLAAAQIVLTIATTPGLIAA